MITAQRRPSSLAMTLIGGSVAGQGPSAPNSRGFIYFWPLYTGTPIPLDAWRHRMWLDTWV
ncbi:hypothetical protein SLA_2948 [Streptomyces laurentii]|uniref:Uncharacterized protein n=1 Tax=Streptomyces laurentii TaxID=39478 RepID=A0A160NZP9_STRLU|nr:hypothetical protein SLA_2948 [Streptomyces laurentii]